MYLVVNYAGQKVTAAGIYNFVGCESKFFAGRNNAFNAIIANEQVCPRTFSFIDDFGPGDQRSHPRTGRPGVTGADLPHPGDQGVDAGLR